MKRAKSLNTGITATDSRDISQQQYDVLIRIDQRQLLGSPPPHRAEAEVL
jgi:hypothetical protein